MNQLDRENSKSEAETDELLCAKMATRNNDVRNEDSWLNRPSSREENGENKRCIKTTICNEIEKS